MRSPNVVYSKQEEVFEYDLDNNARLSLRDAPAATDPVPSAESMKSWHKMGGRMRENQLRLMADAKNLLQYMHNSLDARCQSWDKDIEIKEMEEKLEHHVGLLKQSELKRKEAENELKISEQQIVSIALASSTQVRVGLNVVDRCVPEGHNARRLKKLYASREDVLAPDIFLDYTREKATTRVCYFDANPHPVNLLSTPDGKLAFLDFEMMSETPEEARFAIINHVVHMVNRDYEA
ncbi:hypothetical protein Tco_0920014 [Tanacetum coccineum]